MAVLDRRRLIGGSAAAALGLAAPVVRAQPAPIRVGMIQPMSGGLANYGQDGQPAFDHIVRRINESGGIRRHGGAKLELVVADDASQPARSATEARRLITQERVAMIVGTPTTPQFAAIAPVVEDARMPTFSMWAGISRSAYQYSMGLPYDRGYARPMAEFATYLNRERGYGMKTAALVHSNYETGQVIAGLLRKYLEESGIKVVGEVPLDTKASDMTPAMVRIRSLKPDLIIGLILPRDGVLLQQARFSLNYHEPVYIAPGFGDLAFWKDLGPQIGTQVLTRNLFALVGLSPEANVPAMKKLVEDMKGDPRVHVSTVAIQSAQGARVVQAALEAAESLDPAAILKGLSGVAIKHGDPGLYFAIRNSFRFAEDRLPADGYAVMMQWSAQQRQEVVYPVEFRTTEPRARG
jgi:ABC-type branched-subunit amino acid transport system substrate-binding protein